MNQSEQALARQQYEHGLYSFLNLLDAERNVYTAQDSLAQSGQSIVTGVVTLHKALGGGWEDADAGGSKMTANR